MELQRELGADLSVDVSYEWYVLLWSLRTRTYFYKYIVVYSILWIDVEF
jgi:hypothetical protein